MTASEDVGVATSALPSLVESFSASVEVDVPCWLV